MQAAQPQDPYRAMLRGGLLPALPVAVIALVVAAAVVGWRGVTGSALGSLVVAASFGSSLLVMGRTARQAPHLVMAVALLTYVTKVGVLGLFLAVLVVTGASWLSGPAFGATALAVAAVWLAGEVRAFTRVRTLVFATATPADNLPEP